MTFARERALGGRWSGLSGALLVYTAITLVLFRELLPHLASHLYSDLGDPLLNASILAWNARQVPLSSDWWNFPSFAPVPGVTVFTEHLLLTYPVASPVIWLTGNPVLAYNLVFLIAPPLNGLAAYALGRELTGSSAAGVVAGLAYAFAPYQSVHLSHIQHMVSFGMPFALMHLHRYFRSGRRASLVWFGVGWLVTALANSALLVFFPILVLIWSVWFVRPREWRRLVGPAAAAGVATLPLAPLLWGYYVRHADIGVFRTYGEVRSFSADIVGLLGMYHRAVPWRGVLSHDFEEGALFPGFVTFGLAVAAVVSASKGPGAGLWARRLMRASLVLTTIVLARVWAGPFGWHVGPLALPPFNPYRLFTPAVLLFAAGVLCSDAFRRAWSRRDAVVCCAVGAVAMWLFALGPEPEWSTPWRAMTYGPYSLLLGLPGIQSIRVPARAWFPAMLCLAVLAAFGTARLLERYPRHARAIVATIALFIVAEGWFVDQVVEVPRPMRPGAIPEGAVVLDLPIAEGFPDAVPQFRAVMGGYRTINGYSGYYPRHFFPLRQAIVGLRPDALDRYQREGDVYVILRRGEPGAMQRWVATRRGAERLFELDDATVYRLARFQ